MKVSRALVSLGLSFVTGYEGDVAVWTSAFRAPGHDVDVELRLESTTVVVRVVDRVRVRPVPSGPARGRDATLPMATIGATLEGAWVASARVAESDVDGGPLADAIRTVLLAYQDRLGLHPAAPN